MKTTVTPEWDSTTRTRCKTITGEHGEQRVATIQCESQNNPHETTRKIRFVTNTEGVPVNTADRENTNGGEPTEEECMNQLHQARQEIEGEATERANNRRNEFRDRNEHEQERVDPTDSMNTKTEEEHQERIEHIVNDIMKKLA
jgi:hypothetical protein